MVREDRLALEPVGERAAHVNRAGRTRRSRDSGVDTGFFPRLFDQRLVDACARGDAAADEVVEPAGIDPFVRTAAREPELRFCPEPDDAVDVNGPRPNAEPSCRAALDQKRRSGAE